MSWIGNTKMHWRIRREGLYCNIHTFDVMAEKLTTALFIERARKVHGEMYDYSKVEYVNKTTNVCVICKDHGPFYVAPKKHLVGRGCLECAKQTLWNYDSCLAEAKKYDSESKFKRGSQRAYGVAKRNGWIANYTWFSVLWKPRWSYDECYKEAQKYKSRSEFKKESPSGYSAARTNKWLDDYFWLLPLRKQSGYWTKELCKETAQQYSYVTSFQREQPGAYNAAKKNDWLKDYDWFVSPQKPHGYWNRDNCYKEALKYTSAIELKKNCSAAYNKAHKNGWISDYYWFIIEKKPNGYWTSERCEQESHKYTSRKEFQISCPSAYDVARENKWLDNYNWLINERINIKGNIDSVYAYFFEETHSVYIGRTLMRRQKKRDREHLFTVGNDAVAAHAKSIGVPVPPMVILESNLTLKEGLEQEDYWRKHFEAEGYNVLNRAATGVGVGSLGNIDNGKWNRETCYNEASKYTRLVDFERKSASASAAARRNGWIQDYLWLERKSCLTEETCKEEALKYKSRGEFQKNALTAYAKALKMGWIKQYTWLTTRQKRPSGYWQDYKHCYDEAKKYKNRKGFQNGCISAYSNALKNGWLNDYIWFKEKQKHKYWNKETCFHEAKKYKRITDFAKNAVRAYSVAKENGWDVEYTWFERPFEWTYDLCKSEALKYDTRGHFKVGCTGAYQKSRKQGWLDDFFPKISENDEK